MSAIIENIFECRLLGITSPNVFVGRRECALSFYMLTLRCNAKKASITKLNQLTHKY